MANLTYRVSTTPTLPGSTTAKGTPLTNNEVDANWKALQDEVAGKGAGTVTAVSVASSNGFTGTSSGGATPALTLTTSITGLLKGNGTAISAAVSATDIKTINGTSLLGSGDVVVGGPSGTTSVTGNVTLTSTSTAIQSCNMTGYGKTITLPNATTMTTGPAKFTIKNTNTTNYMVGILNASGTLIGAVLCGFSASINLLSNSTSAGVWEVIQDSGPNVGEFISAGFTLPANRYIVGNWPDGEHRGGSTFIVLVTSGLTSSTYNRYISVYDISTGTLGSELSLGVVANVNVTYLSSTTFAVTYIPDTSTFATRVISVSGSTITAGTAVSWNLDTPQSGGATLEQILVLSSTLYIVSGVTLRESGGYVYGHKALSVSGTTVTGGTNFVVQQGAYPTTLGCIGYGGLFAIDSTHYTGCIAWPGPSADGYLHCGVFTVSGTTISSNVAYLDLSAPAGDYSVGSAIYKQLSATSYFVHAIGGDAVNGSNPYMWVGTVSGGTITFGARYSGYGPDRSSYPSYACAITDSTHGYITYTTAATPYLYYFTITSVTVITKTASYADPVSNTTLTGAGAATAVAISYKISYPGTGTDLTRTHISFADAAKLVGTPCGTSYFGVNWSGSYYIVTASGQVLIPYSSIMQLTDYSKNAVNNISPNLVSSIRNSSRAVIKRLNYSNANATDAPVLVLDIVQ